MTDARLRDLERRWKESGAVEDEVEYLKERLRVMDLAPERVDLAAYCGAPAAALVTQGRAEVPSGTAYGVLVAGSLGFIARTLDPPWPALYRPVIRLFRLMARSARTPAEATVQAIQVSYVQSSLEARGYGWQVAFPPSWAIELLAGDPSARTASMNRLRSHAEAMDGARAYGVDVLQRTAAWCLSP